MPQLFFIIQLIFFLLLIFILFTIPGSVFLKKTSGISFWQRLVISTIMGWILFTLAGYTLLTLNLKPLLLPLFLITILLSLKGFKSFFGKINLPSKKLLLILIPIFILGIIFQLAITFPSGANFGGDILFWSSHAHDASWHIGLMSQMENGWPIQNPVFAGERLVNYHFFSDIAPMYFHYLFRFSYLDLYFRFFPIFYAVSFASMAYILGRKITGSFWGGFWSFIFADFAGSFGFVVTFLRNRTIGGESLFWSSQPQSTIGNPPQMSALILLMTFFCLFALLLEKKTKLLFTALILLGGMLMSFKVYAGVALLGGLGITALWQVIKERKFTITLLLIISTVLSAVLFLPNIAKSSSFLILEPWWYIRTLVVAPDRLGKVEWELRRQTYIAEDNLKRVIQLEVQAFLIFLFGNLGMRFLGFLVLPKYFKDFFKNYFRQLLFSVALISFLFPIFFIQKGETAGTSQFFQYFLLIFGFFAAEAVVLLGSRIKPISLKIILSTLIIVFAVPTQLGLLTTFYQRSAFAKIDFSEQEALNFLQNNTPKDSVILAPLFNKYLQLNLATPPLWGWSDTGYISAFSNRAVYLADEAQVANTGYEYLERKELAESLFNTTDIIDFEKIFKKSGADYLYFPLVQKPNVDLDKTSLKLIFSSSSIQIWGYNNKP